MGTSTTPTRAWTRLLGTSSNDEAYALTSGTDGAIYMAGVTSGNLDGQTSSGFYDAFLTKYDANGSKAWTRLLGTSEGDYAMALTTGTDGAIYMAGSTFGSLDGQTNSGNYDAFLTKYDANGSKAWTRLLGTSSDNRVSALTTGTDGAIYMAGYTEGSLEGQTFGGGYSDAFLTKYDVNGNKAWTKLLGSSSFDNATALTTGTDGAIYMAGDTAGSLDGQSNSGDFDAFLTKYDSNGSTAWTRLLGTSSEDRAYALTTGTDGAIYIAGATNGSLDGNNNSGLRDAFLAKYSPDGSKVWTRLLGTSLVDHALALTTGADGAIYMAGYTYGSVEGQNNGGISDAFLTKYDANGNSAWTRLLGTSPYDEAWALTTGTDGAIYMAGKTESGLDGQTNGGLFDAFITKWVVMPTAQFATSSGSTPEGNTGSTTVTVQATLSAVSTQAVTIPIIYSGSAIQGTDYTTATWVITIAAGQTTGTASFSVTGDTSVEPDETVIITLGTPTNAVLGANATHLHIIDNDDLDPPMTGNESFGAVQLVRTVTGTSEVVDTSGQRFTVKDNNNTVWTNPPGNQVVAADYYQGYRVVVFNHGHAWYMDATWTKAPVGPGGADTLNFSQDQIQSIFLPSGASAPPVAEGSRAWTRMIGAMGPDQAEALVTGSDGSVYVAGSTMGSLDGQPNLGGEDAFLVKYDAQGNKLWTKQFGSGSSDWAQALTKGSDGSVYVAGRTSGNLDGQPNLGGEDAFLIKYDAQGNKLWTKQFGSGSSDWAQALTKGSDGSVYVAGHTWGSLDGQPNLGSNDAFLIKYDAQGNKLWTKQFGSNQSDWAQALTRDSDGSVYVAGRTMESLDGQPNLGGEDAFLIKYDTQGNKLWTKQFGSNQMDWAQALTKGPDGSVYVAGNTMGSLDGQPYLGSNDAFLTKYSAEGARLWTRTLGSTMSDWAEALAVGTDGSIYLGGYVTGSVDGQPSSGGQDAFLAKYTADGTKVWTKLLGSSSMDWARALAIGTDASVYMAGYTHALMLDGQPSNGGTDAFLTKWLDDAIAPRTGRTKYFVTQNAGGNFTDFDLNYPGVTLRSESIEFIGSAGVDTAFVRPGVVLDFTFSGAGSDKVYLTGAFNDYTRSLAGNTITLERGSGSTLEKVSVVAATSAEASDQLVFSDGVVNSHALYAHLLSQQALPVPNPSETSLTPLPPAQPGSPLNAEIRAFGLNPDGDTYATMKPGVALMAHGGIGIDKVYVAEGSNVDAIYLGPSADEIYMRGAWAEYSKSVEGTSILLTRSVGVLTESIRVAAGNGALNDTLIFADGSVSSLPAMLALQGNATADIQSVTGFNASRVTPGVGPELKYQSLDDVTNLDPASNLVLTYSLPVTAVPGKMIRIVDDGGTGTNGEGFRGENSIFSRNIAVDDSTRVTIIGQRVIINPSRDLDLASKYHIEIDQGAFVSAAGKPSDAFNGTTTLNFSTVIPGQATLENASASRKFDSAGTLVNSYKWLDIEGLGSKGSSIVNLDLSQESVALAFKDYASRPTTTTSGYDGVGPPTFYVGAMGFGEDDLIYIDNQSTEPNDLTQTAFLNTGSPPTKIQFAADTAANPTSLGGYLDVTLVGSTQPFASINDWMAKLPSAVPPMISG